MSRWDLDPPDDDRYDEPPNATCTDCGIAYAKAEHDPTTTCDGCSDRRDAWATATELRMAKAAIAGTDAKASAVPVVVEVALVPTLPPDAGAYLAWLDGLRANARYGSDALAHAWYIAPPAYAQHLLTVAPDLWMTVKAIARRAA